MVTSLKTLILGLGDQKFPWRKDGHASKITTMAAKISKSNSEVSKVQKPAKITPQTDLGMRNTILWYFSSLGGRGLGIQPKSDGAKKSRVVVYMSASSSCAFDLTENFVKLNLTTSFAFDLTEKFIKLNIAQSGNYENSVSHFFDKNYVKSTVLLKKKLLKS